MYRKNNFLYNDEQDTIIECLDKMIESFAVPKDIKFICENAFKDCYLLNTLCIDGNDELTIYDNTKNARDFSHVMNCIFKLNCYIFC